MATSSSSEQMSQVRHSTEAPKGSARRKACNECKQQKIRCSLISPADEAPSVCSRCLKLGLDCKIELSFRRTRKRRRTIELEDEVKELKSQLITQASRQSVPDVIPSMSPPQTSTSLDVSRPRVVDVNLRGPEISASPRSELSRDAAEYARAPGLTTRPIIDIPQSASRATMSTPQARTLGDIHLSIIEIDELFKTYMDCYHPCLPFLDPTVSPQRYYDTSELLFWSVISIASRRSDSKPTLLTSLARSVTDLLWRTMRTIPHSLQVVQSLIILCAWPFPTSSSTADPTYVLAGMMVSLGSQMGLHRAWSAQDFTKVPLNLNTYEHSEWVKTWEACNIVAHSVSVGCGLPTGVQLQDWSLTIASDFAGSTPGEISLRSHLRIEQFRHRVSQALATNAMDPAGLTSMRERLSLYRLLNTVFGDLERDVYISSPGLLSRFYLSAARLHLHAFYLFDESNIDGYNDRIATLYQTAATFIQQAIEMDTDMKLFQHCPFFCYQMFVCASFIVLKITRAKCYDSLIDTDAAKKLLNPAIYALRKMSVANNDLPARLSDVIGFFCSAPGPGLTSGQMANSMQLRVRNRLSMSIVYDSLWEWRKHFQMSQESNRVGNVNTAEVINHGFEGSLAFSCMGDFSDTFRFEWLDDFLNAHYYN